MTYRFLSGAALAFIAIAVIGRIAQIIAGAPHVGEWAVWAYPFAVGWSLFLTAQVVGAIERAHRKPEVRMTITSDRTRE